MSDNALSKWQALYNQSDQVRRLADKIHNSLPVFDQCIEMAVKQLKADPLKIGIEFGAVFPPTVPKSK